MPDEAAEGTDRGNAFVQFYRWVFGIGHERNIGGSERAIRYTLGVLLALVGVAALAVPILGDGLANVAAAVVLIVGGAYLIYEAQVQYCPLNHTVDRSTYADE